MEKKSYTFDEIKKKLVSYCLYQDRCHHDLEMKMRDYFLIQEAKDKILLYLIQENFLNEERFVRSYVRGKFYYKNWGRIKIKNSLKLKDISEKLIQKCFDEIENEDYDKIILKLYQNHYQSQMRGSEFEKNSKTVRYLISKGFEYEEISKVISEMKESI